MWAVSACFFKGSYFCIFSSYLLYQNREVNLSEPIPSLKCTKREIYLFICAQVPSSYWVAFRIQLDFRQITPSMRFKIDGLGRL